MAAFHDRHVFLVTNKLKCKFDVGIAGNGDDFRGDKARVFVIDPDFCALLFGDDHAQAQLVGAKT